MRKWGNGNSDKEKRGQYCSTAHPLRVARAVRARLTCGDASFSFVSAIMLPRFFILGADIVLLVGLGVLARCESSPPISAPQNWTVPLREATVVCGVCLGFWLQVTPLVVSSQRTPPIVCVCVRRSVLCVTLPVPPVTLVWDEEKTLVSRQKARAQGVCILANLTQKGRIRGRMSSQAGDSLHRMKRGTTTFLPSQDFWEMLLEHFWI